MAEPTESRDPNRTIHVTFVCTGNICRSPIAEKVFAARVDRAGLADRVRVSSAGTGDWHVGDGADNRARAVLRAHGYPTDHVAAQVAPDHLGADLVVALDTGHERALGRLGVPRDRIRLLRSFDPDADSRDVADPYYGDNAEFEVVLSQVEAAVPELLAWVRDRLTATVEPCEG
ncbi:low molecular weight phosphotyrosine protein phosphatase [Aldersonia sp. NBC_00410]|uniref:low molecular weight protein-tyrosine-phosphatase n=1 Tax=Aldersonia sp. NBC_00410 TaxID=2975954 RepID=UPI002250F1CF|nr:low molecular weight protein-tyrosine-phosphatase [Aldersonia sp. NBC_00410]MCX5042644.1 low molecular weight phosphotyrosine protein phosphatase [Aldersonia sp. NBC_00410]